jgi:hypothetical protein
MYRLSNQVHRAAQATSIPEISTASGIDNSGVVRNIHFQHSSK